MENILIGKWFLTKDCQFFGKIIGQIDQKHYLVLEFLFPDNITALKEYIEEAKEEDNFFYYRIYSIKRLKNGDICNQNNLQEFKEIL